MCEEEEEEQCYFRYSNRRASSLGTAVAGCVSVRIAWFNNKRKKGKEKGKSVFALVYTQYTHTRVRADRQAV